MGSFWQGKLRLIHVDSGPVIQFPSFLGWEVNMHEYVNCPGERVTSEMSWWVWPSMQLYDVIIQATRYRPNNFLPLHQWHPNAFYCIKDIWKCACSRPSFCVNSCKFVIPHWTTVTTLLLQRPQWLGDLDLGAFRLERPCQMFPPRMVWRICGFGSPTR